jgi:hypothetical protein
MVTGHVPEVRAFAVWVLGVHDIASSEAEQRAKDQVGYDTRKGQDGMKVCHRESHISTLRGEMAFIAGRGWV